MLTMFYIDNPSEIFRCDVQGCDQEFVRIDLLNRHKKRHTPNYTPRNRIPSFNTAREHSDGYPGPSPTGPPRQGLNYQQHPHGSNGPHDAAILLTPESNHEPAALGMQHTFSSRHNPPSGWVATSGDERPSQGTILRKPGYFSSDDPQIDETHLANNFSNLQYSADDALSQANFAAWLFDPQTSYNDLTLQNLPFLETGLESTFNSNIHYDYESLTSQSQLDLSPPRQVESDDLISEGRRQELVRWIQMFRKKQPRYDALMPNLIHESGGDLPAMNVDMVRECLKEFWENVSPRLAIVHQHTFSPNRCPIFLLLVILALGASSAKQKDTTGRMAEFGPFADVIIASVRWEILTSDDSAPPASLWVTQALLLLEFYEKFCSTRKFHERAHIYHSSFLTLLRRGSPLIGRAGSESPPETDSAPGTERQTPAPGLALDARSWWVRWAETESMHRVVFAAFMLDVVHAAMFGHAADMAAHEIRLPLPCDDSLWTASSPDVVRQLEANFRMYGVKQVSFLDGLKSALHGKEVKVHSFGRMIIMSGLLSVGWHLGHRETHLKWADLRPSSETQDNWRKMLLRAFDNWKESFDVAVADSMSSGARDGPAGPVSSASLLYHLAHISMHSDIVDCQVYAGAKRLLGRRISHRDYSNAVKRMNTWANQASTRHAVHHAFKLLYDVLVGPTSRRRQSSTLEVLSISYSLRNDSDPHRPWIMYYAVLTIWAFVQALGVPSVVPHSSALKQNAHLRVASYISGVATLSELSDRTARTLFEGLPELLDLMILGILGETDAELLREARERLTICRNMLSDGPRG